MAYIGQAPTNVPLTSADIEDGTIALADLSATGTKDATTFLRGDNTFATAGGTNTPAFHVDLSSDQSVSDVAVTKVQFDTELFDTANAYDNSTNYRFTPQTAGKYWVYFSCVANSSSTSQLTNTRVFIYKNGAKVALSHFDVRTTKGFEYNNYLGQVISLNGSSDYIEFFARVDHDGTGVVRAESYAGAYKIIE